MAKHAAPRKTAQKSDETRKLRAHVVCIVISIVFSIGTTFVTTGIAVHLLTILPSLPAIGQEITDFVNRW